MDVKDDDEYHPLRRVMREAIRVRKGKHGIRGKRKHEKPRPKPGPRTIKTVYLQRPWEEWDE